MGKTREKKAAVVVAAPPMENEIPLKPKAPSAPPASTASTAPQPQQFLLDVSAAGIGKALFMVAQEESKAREPLYWSPKNKTSMINKEIINWTNKAIMKNPRLLQIKGNENSMVMKEVLKRRDSLNTGDVFILDTGNLIYIWHGKDSNKFEQQAAFEVVSYMCQSRGMNTHYTILEQAGGGDDCENFWKEIRNRPLFCGFENYLGGTYNVRSSAEGGKDTEVKPFSKKLYPIKVGRSSVQRQRAWYAKLGSGASKDGKSGNGSLSNQFAKRKLDSSKAYLLDDGFHIWVWKGKDSSITDNDAYKEAVSYLKEKSNHVWYKQSHNRPVSLPIMIVQEDKEPEAFHANFKHVRKSRGLFI